MFWLKAKHKWKPSPSLLNTFDMNVMIASLEHMFGKTSHVACELQGSEGWSLFPQGWYHVNGSNWREEEAEGG